MSGEVAETLSVLSECCVFTGFKVSTGERGAQESHAAVRKQLRLVVV